MANNNRLQFVHYSKLFATSQEARDYVNQLITEQRCAMFAEPMVLKYGEDAENPNILLAIGSLGDGETPDASKRGKYIVNNSVFFIDLADVNASIATIQEQIGELSATTQEISDLVHAIIQASGFDEEGYYVGDAEDTILSGATDLTNADSLLSQYLLALEKKVKLNVVDSNTIDLSVSVDNISGTTISGDVKVPSTRIINNVVTDNIIITDETGIFTNVNLGYKQTADGQVITLYVNGEATTSFTLPTEVHVVKGDYNKKTETLDLTLNNNEVIPIDMVDLIEEWTVEDARSTTPIVLTKTHVPYEDKGHDESDWKDILSGDVRITKKDDNILTKTDDGLALYVKGTADNIKYTDKTVEEALDASFKEIAEGSIIRVKPDGLYADVQLDYISTTNTLVFYKTQRDGSSLVSKQIQLNAVKFIKSARYVEETESLEIVFENENGDDIVITIPLKNLIEEYYAENTDHNVHITIVRNVNTTNKSSISADILRSSAENNILTEIDHRLYVGGVASNIKYGDDTVESTLNNLLGDENVDGSIKNLIASEASARTDADKALSDVIDTKADKTELASVSAHVEDLQAYAQVVSGGVDTEGSIKNVLYRAINYTDQQVSGKTDISATTAVSDRVTVLENYANTVSGNAATPGSILYAEAQAKAYAYDLWSGETAIREAQIKAVSGAVSNTYLYADAISGQVKSLSAEVKGDETIITNLGQDLTDLSAKTITAVTIDKESNLKYVLSINGAQTSSVIDIPKDQFLKTVSYSADIKSLVFEFETTDGVKRVEVKVDDLVDTYNAGSALTLDEATNTFNVKLSPQGETKTYLSIDEFGIAINGIGNAIESATSGKVENSVFDIVYENVQSLQKYADTVSGNSAVTGSILNAISQANTYTDNIAKTKANNTDLETVSGHVDTLQVYANIVSGNSATTGSIKNAIAEAEGYAEGLVATKVDFSTYGTYTSATDNKIDVLQSYVNIVSGNSAQTGSIEYALAQSKEFVGGYTYSKKESDEKYLPISYSANIDSNTSNIEKLSSSTTTLNSNLTSVSATVDSMKTTYIDTSSIDVTVTVNENNGKTVSAVVKKSEVDKNAVQIADDGLYVKNGEITYDETKNILTFHDNLGNPFNFALNSSSVIKGMTIEYSGGVQCLVIEYETKDGESEKVSVPIAQFFKGIEGSTSGNVTTTTSLTTAHESDVATAITANLDVSKIIDNTDTTVNLYKTKENKISANVNISNLDDNWLVSDNNSLYVGAKNSYQIIHKDTTVGASLESISGDVIDARKEMATIETRLSAVTDNTERIVRLEFASNNYEKILGVSSANTDIHFDETNYLKHSRNVVSAITTLDSVIKGNADAIQVLSAYTNEKLSAISATIDTFSASTDSRFSAVSATIESFSASVESRLSSISDSYSALTKMISAMSATIDDIKAELVRLDAKSTLYDASKTDEGVFSFTRPNGDTTTYPTSAMTGIGFLLDTTDLDKDLTSGEDYIDDFDGPTA